MQRKIIDLSKNVLFWKKKKRFGKVVSLQSFELVIQSVNVFLSEITNVINEIRALWLVNQYAISLK